MRDQEDARTPDPSFRRLYRRVGDGPRPRRGVAGLEAVAEDDVRGRGRGLLPRYYQSPRMARFGFGVGF